LPWKILPAIHKLPEVKNSHLSVKQAGKGTIAHDQKFHLPALLDKDPESPQKSHRHFGRMQTPNKKHGNCIIVDPKLFS
jgi:hypothetical protein